jgi:hypothetical protein
LPWGLYGNLRLSEVVFHGERLGASHPDVIAQKPVAVLFDEGEELKDILVTGSQGLSFQFDGAFQGSRFIKQEADRLGIPTFVPPFGHVIPNWDFEIAENPKPGQYRYVQFAWRALSPKTRGMMLQLGGDRYGIEARCFVGENKPEAGTIPKKLGATPPTDWHVERVDLWELFKAPTHIRGLRLSTVGGPAAFDQILLGRTVDDFPRPKN